MSHTCSEKKMAKRKLLKLVPYLFALICVGGMLFQLSGVLRLYLEYKAESQMTIGIPNKMKIHTLSFCISMEDFTDFRPETNDSTHKVYEITTNEQMISKTPPAEDLLVGFKVRQNTFEWDKKNKSMISDFWNLSKFTLSDYVCYKIDPIDAPLVDVTAVATTPYGTGGIYHLYLNRSYDFERIKMFLPVLHTEKYPHVAFGAAVHATRESAINNRSEMIPEKPPSTANNWSRMQPQTIRTRLLEPPYETNCFNYSRLGYESQMECSHTCRIMKTIVELNRLPFSVVISQSYDLKYFSRLDRRDEDRRRLFDEIVTSCESGICSRPACESILTITHTKQEVGTDFMLSHVVPVTPWIVINHRPVLSLIELVTYVMGIVSTYTGFSILSLEPVRLLRKFWTKKSQETACEQIRIFPRDAKIRTARIQKNKSYITQNAVLW